MDVLVTGGAGFLGRHISKAMALAGHEVTVLDDLSCRNSSFDCPELRTPGIRCIRGSTLDAQLVSRLVAEHREIFHFASVVGVEETISRPLETMKNLEGTLRITEAMTPNHRVVFTSSADVYGLHSQLYERPMREDDLQLFEDAAVGRWVYPKVKSLEESAILNAPGPGLVIRVFNCFGPGMDFPHGKRVVPQFIERILAKLPLRISGTGEQTRALCYWSDTVRGLILGLDFLREHRQDASTVINVGADKPLSVLAIARGLMDIALQLELIDQPLPIELNAQLYSQTFDDSWDRVPDLERAQTLLGYQPQVSIEEGFKATLEYYRDFEAFSSADLKPESLTHASSLPSPPPSSLSSASPDPSKLSLRRDEI